MASSASRLGDWSSEIKESNEAEFRRLHGLGLGAVEIAKRMGVDVSTARKWRRHLDLPPFPPVHVIYPGKRRFSDDELRRAHAEGLTAAQAAARFGVRISSLNARRQKLGLPNFKNKYDRSKPKYDWDLVRQYTEAGLTCRQIADRIGATKRTVSRIRGRLGIGIGAPGEPYPREVKDRALVMLKDGASYKETSRTLGIPEARLRRWYPGMGWTPKQAIEYRHMRRELARLEGRQKTGTDWQ